LASKDQAIGALIFLVCVVVAIGYVVVLVAPGTVRYLLPWVTWSDRGIQFWAVAIVVLIAFLAIMFIGAWIGWTMATTPPPKPIEELELEEEEEEKLSEETKAEEEGKKN
jgi:H+/Cl- antiporter ClcA